MCNADRMTSHLCLQYLAVPGTLLDGVWGPAESPLWAGLFGFSGRLLVIVLVL